MRIAPKSADDRRKFRVGGYGLPADAVKDPRSNDAGEAWRFERVGAMYAIVFRGSAFRAEWYYRFKSEAERAARIDRFFESVASWNERVAAAREERKAAPRGLEVGDILRSSWGYDQTNIDYYEVTRLIGKNRVEIREIAQDSKEDQGWLRGSCVPVPGRYIGEPMVKVARNGSVRIASYASASKVAPLAQVAGKKLYAPSNWTAYA